MARRYVDEVVISLDAAPENARDEDAIFCCFERLCGFLKSGQVCCEKFDADG